VEAMMTLKTLSMTTDLQAYVVTHGTPPDEIVRYWERAGVSDRIELRIGPAAERLKELPAEPHLDLAFIDADKTGYPTYWAEIVPRMRPGGLILVDNVLRHGRVLAPNDAGDHAIVKFNEQVLGDERVDQVLLPIADGLTLARRR
jgi:caffeoyl-CoA O-methyltransferase